MGKQFLVVDKAEERKWKMSPGATKNILGYNCMKATFSDSTTDIIAWWSPEIPIQTGPNGMSQLPGLVLGIEIAGEQLRGGRMEITATSFDKTVNLEELVPPTKGKKVDNEEFEKIQEKKIKEMQEMYGGGRGGGVRVITN